jgi:hypothetical protein
LTNDETEQIFFATRKKLEEYRSQLKEDMNDDEFNRLRTLMNEQLFILHICEDLLKWSEDERKQRLGKIIIN